MSAIHKFGRLIKKDPRDKKYLLSSILPKETEKTQQFWGSTVFLNQGSTNKCVGYGWAHWVDDPPVLHEKLIDPNYIYDEAQKIDGFPLPHEGSTVRAGVQVLQNCKLVKNYYWASHVSDIVMAVLELGPVTVGTNWYTDMSKVDSAHTMKPTGLLEGGHCYDINGVDTVRGIFRIKNSWGVFWADGGQAFISIEDFARLLYDDGEACLAIEAEGPVPDPPLSWWQRFINWLRSLFSNE